MLLAIAFLLILIWFIPAPLLVAGATCLVSGGATKQVTLTKKHPYFNTPIKIEKPDKKWLTGDLKPDTPLAPYIGHGKIVPDVKIIGFDIKKMERRALHWGQRKLLLTEIDFLSHPDLNDQTVVYAGAADGRHIPFLAELFPKTVFHLYDPRPFYKRCITHPRIKINPFYNDKPKTDTTGFFTDEVAAWYKGQRTWFVSDIRTRPSEHEIMANQAAQANWVRIMCPERSMLKFKMPYPAEGAPTTYDYLDGHIRLQCWPPIRSAETRLIVEGVPKNRQWDILRYEQQCSWYNSVMRLADFGKLKLRTVVVDSDETVDEFWNRYASNVPHGSDFVYELQILTKYIRIKNARFTDLHELVQKINRSLLGPGETFTGRLRHQGLDVPD